MIKILRLCSSQIRKTSYAKSVIFRSISTTETRQLKEIREYEDGGAKVFEGVYVEHPKAKNFLKFDNLNECCTVCATGLDIKHTDVKILSQFVRPDGCMLPKRITGLCFKQQKRIGTLVTMAQKAGLMINLTPAYCKKDPHTRRQWKKFNTYFDEATIGVKKTREIPFYERIH